MKKTLLIATTLFISSHFQSQIVKGTKYVGLNLSFNKGKNDNLENTNSSITKNYDFSFAPSFNYFIKDNFAIGGNIGAGFYKNSENRTNINISDPNYIDLNEDKSTTYSAGFSGIYYKKILEKFYFVSVFDLSYNYSFGINSSIYHSQNYIHEYINKSIINNVALNFSPGFTYFITPKFGLNVKTNLFSLQFQNTLYNTNYTNIYQYSPEYNQIQNLTSSRNTIAGGLYFLPTFSISLNYFF